MVCAGRHVPPLRSSSRGEDLALGTFGPPFQPGLSWGTRVCFAMAPPSQGA